MAGSTLWVAHIEDTEDSRALGSRMMVGTKLTRSWAAASDPDGPLPPPATGGDGECRSERDAGFEGGLSYGLARLGRVEILGKLNVGITLTGLALVPRSGSCRQVFRRRRSCSGGTGTSGGRGSGCMKSVQGSGLWREENDEPLELPWS